MIRSRGLHFTLECDGDESLDLAVTKFIHTEGLSETFELTVDFASHDRNLDPADFLDRGMTLTVWRDGEALRRVHGIVAEFGRGDSGHRRTFYKAVIRPPLWRLSLRHNSRIFQRVSPLTIIETLCQERGLRDVTFVATRPPEEREYCVQYRETDLDFIQRLAAEEGLFYYHVLGTDGQTTNAHELVFCDQPKVLTNLGERTYHSRAGGTPPARHVRKLEQVSRVRPSSVALQDHSFKNPAYSQLHQAQLHEHRAEGLDRHADYEHYDYPGRFKRDASGKPFTRIRLERLRHDAVTAKAESDLPELAPGYRFTLTDHDADSLNRDWQVVSVTHTGKQPQALEEDAVGSDGMTTYENTLTLTPGDVAWRPEPTPKPCVDGPQVATVVGPEGEDIHTDEFGRVRVLFPWNREGTASAWLRVAQSWAGGGYGSIALPRVGHGVVVSFLEGDPDQPLITGRVHHAVNTPPYALPEHKTRTVIRTQTHHGEGFNELRFEDANGAEQIWLHAERDQDLQIGHDRAEAVGNDRRLSVRHARVSDIAHDDHLRVRGERRCEIDGDEHHLVRGSHHEKAGQAILLEGSRQLHLKSDSRIVLEAGGGWLRIDGSGLTFGSTTTEVASGGAGGMGQAAQAPMRLESPDMVPSHASSGSPSAFLADVDGDDSDEQFVGMFPFSPPGTDRGGQTE